MYTSEAERFFGGRAGIARALSKFCSTSAVYQWKDVVPLLSAHKLSDLSGGKLKVDVKVYERRKRRRCKG